VRNKVQGGGNIISGIRKSVGVDGGGNVDLILPFQNQSRVARQEGETKFTEKKVYAED